MNGMNLEEWREEIASKPLPAHRRAYSLLEIALEELVGGGATPRRYQKAMDAVARIGALEEGSDAWWAQIDAAIYAIADAERFARQLPDPVWLEDALETMGAARDTLRSYREALR